MFSVSCSPRVAESPAKNLERFTSGEDSLLKNFRNSLYKAGYIVKNNLLVKICYLRHWHRMPIELHKEARRFLRRKIASSALRFRIDRRRSYLDFRLFRNEFGLEEKYLALIIAGMLAAASEISRRKRLA